MACAVAGRLWEEEVGGRPMKTILEPKRKGSSVKEDRSHLKRRRKRSPFRPWTPELEDLSQQSGRVPLNQDDISCNQNSSDSTSLGQNRLENPEGSKSPSYSSSPGMTSGGGQESQEPLNACSVPASETSQTHLPPSRRNYKNMTRERRIEANARERTRVHTISAAFENLRKAVPAYSHNQKLSKLAVLRVAASYILTLSRIIDQDYSVDQTAPSLESCVQSITNTIQMEGRLKKKKED